LNRDECPDFEVCGRTGHKQTEEGEWTRCNCLQQEIHKRQLGSMYCENPKKSSNLQNARPFDLVLEGPLDSLRPHISSVLLGMSERNDSFLIIDAYRLIEIFLSLDPTLETSHSAVDVDLLIVLLGFADPPNRYLPELLMQTYTRRNMLQKPTWTVLGLEKGQLARKYSEDVFNYIEKTKSARLDR